MTFALIDDGLYDHPKLLRAGEDAADLFVRGIVWCCRHLTDGVIPAEALPRLTSRRSAKTSAARLVEVGLWISRAEGGWSVHDFLDHNPSREVVEARRSAVSAKRAEAGRIGGKRSGEARRANSMGSNNEANAKQTRSNDEATGQAKEKQIEAPSHPIPSPENKHTPRAREGASVREAPGDADTLVDTLSRASKGAVSSVATLEHQQALACTLADLGVVGAAEVERFGAALADGGMKRYAPWLKVDRVTCAYLLRDGARTLTELVDRWRDPTLAASPSVDLSDPWEAAKARYEAEERERIAKLRAERAARKAAGGAS